jgi:hypothetical protein
MLAEIIDSPTDWIAEVVDPYRLPGVEGYLRGLVEENNASTLEAKIAEVVFIATSPRLPHKVSQPRRNSSYWRPRDPIWRRLRAYIEDLGGELERIREPQLLSKEYERELGASKKEARKFSEYFVIELHGLLCSDKKYDGARESLLKEYHAGRSSLVAGIAAALAPHLGQGAEFIAVAVAVSLAVIGQVGLNAWCASQSERQLQRRFDFSEPEDE